MGREENQREHTVTSENAEPAGEERALFRRQGDLFVPSLLTTGPWRRDAMHGGPPGGLIGVVAEAALEEGEVLASVQMDLEKPVPIVPLRVAVNRRSLSRRVSHLVVQLFAGDERVVSAKVLVLRSQPVETIAPPALELPALESLRPMDWSESDSRDYPIFHRDVVEHRVARGGYGVTEPTAAWLRLCVPVVAGETSSPIAELLSVADFGSALSTMVAPGTGMGLINVDVNVSLFRQPKGPWFFLDALGRVGSDGIGLATTAI